MPSARRLCPLCESEMPDLSCPVHDVPTIAVGHSQGPAAKLEVGSVLVDRYVIDGLLSQGGMGALLRARRLPEGQEVVIKVLRGQRIAEIQNVRRFYQEARVASALHHPNIVRIIEFGVDEATRAPFLAMEYVEGRTLKALIGEAGALGEARTAGIFVQIARALLAAHDHGILHRDLKPSNVMVSPVSDGEEHVKVLDFGLAKILSPDPEMSPLTQPGKTVGTPAYMSPEQVTQRPQDFRSDLYGLGCMLHAALTGGPPFVGDDLIAVMRKQMRDPPPPLPDRLFDGRAPSFGLAQLHRQLLKKNKNERPASTEEVVRTFESLLSRDHRHSTTSPKEKRHGLAIIPLATHEPSDQDRGAIETLAAQTQNERPLPERIANVDTDLDSSASYDSATVLTPGYTARSESATQLGGIPPAITFKDALDPATILKSSADFFSPRDPADDDVMDVFASSGAYPETTDPESAAYAMGERGFGEEATDGALEATGEMVPTRAPSRSWNAPTPVEGTPARPLQEPLPHATPTVTREAEAPPGFVDPSREDLAATGAPDDSASGLATMRGSISDLNALSEDVLTTILPSDLDGSEMVDAGTPVVDEASFEGNTDAGDSTRRLGLDPLWETQELRDDGATPIALVVPERANGSVTGPVGRASSDPSSRATPSMGSSRAAPSMGSSRATPSTGSAPARATGSLSSGFEDPAAKFLPVDEPPPPPQPPVRRRPRPARGRGVIVVLAGAAICVSVAVLVWFEQWPSMTPESVEGSAADTSRADPAGEDTPRIVPRARTVSVESRPRGAEVFLGDRHLGRTPVTIDAPSATQILRFEKRGFDEELVEIRPDVGDVLEVRLRRRP